MFRQGSESIGIFSALLEVLMKQSRLMMAVIIVLVNGLNAMTQQNERLKLMK